MILSSIFLIFSQIDGQIVTGNIFYAERGVTLCTSTVKYSVSWIKRLLKQMGKLKYNQLLFECKMQISDLPKQNTWPYYTKKEISEIIAFAKRYNIEVIPEINAPAHMEVWLKNAPEYAISNNAGEIDIERLNFIDLNARNFYKYLIDEYLEIFESRYWHMGADEFDYRVSYADYPQIEAYAQEKYGVKASAHDAFIEFINDVNSYVKSKGKILRIWNDGLRHTNVLSVNKDIIIEYWLNRGIAPQELIDAGYTLMNVPQYLYYSRSVPFYGLNGSELYDSENWNLRNFDAGPAQSLSDLEQISLNPAENSEISSPQKIDVRGVPVVTENRSGKICGIRLSLWPDFASCQTANEVLQEIQPGLGLVSHMAIEGTRNWDNWEEASKYFATQNPQPCCSENDSAITELSGKYLIPELAILAKGSWEITPTEDGYYLIEHSSSGKRLSLKTGETCLGVVNEIGAKAELCPPALPASIHSVEAAEYNAQKWSICLVSACGKSTQADSLDSDSSQANNSLHTNSSDLMFVTLSPALTQMNLAPTSLSQFPPDQGDFVFKLIPSES